MCKQMGIKGANAMKNNVLIFGSDRLGERVGINLGKQGCAVFIIGKWGWAGAIHFQQRRLWLRPIDYAAAELAGPYRRSNRHPIKAVKHAWKAAKAIGRAVYHGQPVAHQPKEP